MKKVAIVMLMAGLVAGCGSPQSGAKKTSKAAQEMAQNKFLNEGILHLQKADTGKAVKSFDMAIKQNPTDPRGYIILGQTYMRMNDYDRAIDSLSAASYVAPDQGEVFYLLAINHRLAGNSTLAKQSAQKSIDLFRQKQDAENFKRSLALLKSLMK